VDFLLETDLVCTTAIPMMMPGNIVVEATCVVVVAFVVSTGFPDTFQPPAIFSLIIAGGWSVRGNLA